jgi:hypothetical protein
LATTLLDIGLLIGRETANSDARAGAGADTTGGPCRMATGSAQGR